ncbi:hypothetical protein E1B28_002130 [Marasmius oreades]|uniref:Uncharacterized protein n=1 Tax=Marasmius oreades TaxID=181124 RepID=A0A9P7RM00_9AGAR|nr:uncharacterized protein E1B28_002130 [Marasmius oreades]KAG7086171.1 hypothetical protein E1B28_002130 [Marasmius oreades]
MATQSDYVLATAAGLQGTKAQMRKQNKQQLRSTLEMYSPCPPRSRWYQPHHRGHAVTAPILCTKRPLAGAWIQVCKFKEGSECEKPHYLTQPLHPLHTTLGPFPELYAVEDELKPISRNSTTQQVVELNPRDYRAMRTVAPVMIDLTLDDDDDYMKKISLVIWLKHRKEPVEVVVNCKSEGLRMDDHRILLGEKGVDKIPLEYYSTVEHRWTALIWSDVAPVFDQGLVLIRQLGLKLTRLEIR